MKKNEGMKHTMLHKEKLLFRIIKIIDNVLPSISHLIMKIWYWYVSKVDKNAEATFLNYGYVDNTKLKLMKEDEINNYPIRLYHHIVNAINVKSLDILEVGCGRGGGTSYIARYLKPKSIKGVDLCKKAIRFCKKHYSVKELSFSHGDALNLPFKNNTADVIVNVESSHSYTNMNKFLREIYRILRPNGYFLFADFRNKGLITSLKNQLNNSGLKIIKEEKITSNVIKALHIDYERRLNIVKKTVPKFLYKPAKEFAGVKGTELYKSFVTGNREYLYFVLQKS